MSVRTSSPPEVGSWLLAIRRAASRTARSVLQAPRAIPEAIRWAARGSTDVEAMRFPPVEKTRSSGTGATPSATPGAAPQGTAPAAPNLFRAYLDAKQEGPGIWKWLHYCDIYERHLAKFRGRPVTILEIGVYSGGSIDMWRTCLGPHCRVIGVDIEPSCRSYERPGVEIEIGDQADPEFWRSFFDRRPAEVDIVIDDGGHQVHQQAATLAAVLPQLRPGGVYICEDVHGAGNLFHAYVAGMARHINVDNSTVDLENPERRVVVSTTAFQSAVQSIHLYPFVVVMERSDEPLTELVAPKRGTLWEPFGDAWDTPHRQPGAEASRA